MQTATEPLDLGSVPERLEQLRTGLAAVVAEEKELIRNRAERREVRAFDDRALVKRLPQIRRCNLVQSRFVLLMTGTRKRDPVSLKRSILIRAHVRTSSRRGACIKTHSRLRLVVLGT